MLAASTTDVCTPI
jgi:hypothetical protein